MSFPRLFAGWTTCALLATGAASAGRLSGRGQRLLRRTVISGSAVSGTAGTDDIGRNCARGSPPLVALSQRLSSTLRARCCGSTANMALEPYSRIWQASRLSPAAKSTRCSITHSFRRVCTCLPISSNSGQQSQMVRSLYDCPQIPVGSLGVCCRVIVATHPAGQKKSPVGVTREGIVYELFFTTLPQQAFTACDVVELYLHRGAFEPALSGEDQEI